MFPFMNHTDDMRTAIEAMPQGIQLSSLQSSPPLNHAHDPDGCKVMVASMLDSYIAMHAGAPRPAQMAPGQPNAAPAVMGYPRQPAQQMPPPQALNPLVQHGQMPPLRREATNEYAALFVALIGAFISGPLATPLSDAYALVPATCKAMACSH